MPIKIICSIFLCLSFVVAQAQIGLSPMSPMEFQQRYNQMLNLPGGDEMKLQRFRQFTVGKSLSSLQVKQFATTLVSDLVRYQLALEAFSITSDKQNFFEVYDAFATFSSVFRLHEAIRAPAVPPVVVPQPNNPPQQRSRRPNVNYPSVNNYVGKVGCNLPLSDRDFDFYANEFFNQQNDVARINTARDLMNRYCISMAQFMQLAFAFSLDNSRMAFMKENFPVVFDLENFNFTTAVFSNDLLRNEWMAFARNHLNPLVPVQPEPICEVPAGEFNEIKSTIRKTSSSRTMVSVAKQIITAKKCFNTTQVIELVKLFSFSGDQMEIAKFAYDFTVDKENYFRVADAFSFNSSKEELMRFLKSRQ